MMGGLDDFLQPLVQLEERLVARARWGLLCDALPVLVESAVVAHADAAQEYDEVPGRPAPASLQGLCTDDRGLVEDLLIDADVLENGITTLKAELVFAALAQKGEMDYRSFRQAMRQVAVALYPQLPEADALKLLGRSMCFLKLSWLPRGRLPIYSRINRSPTRRACWSYLSEKEAWYGTRPSAGRRSRRCGGPSLLKRL